MKYCEHAATNPQPNRPAIRKYDISDSSACRGLTTLCTYAINAGLSKIVIILGVIQINESMMLGVYREIINAVIHRFYTE